MNLAYKGAYCDEMFCDFACNFGFTHDGLGVGFPRAEIFCADKVTGYIREYSKCFTGDSCRQSNFANCNPRFNFCMAFGFEPT